MFFKHRKGKRCVLVNVFLSIGKQTLCFGKCFFKHRKGKRCVSVNFSFYTSVYRKKNLKNEMFFALQNSNSHPLAWEANVTLASIATPVKHIHFITFDKNAALLEQQAHVKRVDGWFRLILQISRC